VCHHWSVGKLRVRREESMTSSNIIRWGGLAAMLGGLFWVVWSLLGRVSFEAAGSPFANALLLLAAVLTLGGLVGLHALQGGNYGRIGRAGFYTAAVGLLVQALAALFLLMGSGAWEVRLQWLVAPAGSLIVLVGLVLYGAATTLQAKVLARWCGLGLIVVPPIAFYMHSRIFYGSLALFGVLWVALGYVLWCRIVRQPSSLRVSGKRTSENSPSTHSSE
jgi:hypothetical protein